MVGLKTDTTSFIMRYKAFHVAIIFLMMATSITGIAYSASNEPEVDKYWIDHSYFYWVTDQVDDVASLKSFFDKDQLPEEQIRFNSYGGVTHARISLKDGLNPIRIKKGRQTMFMADLFYAPSFMSRQVPRSYQQYFFHIPEKEAACGGESCHRMEARESDITPKPYTQGICYSCHKDLVENNQWVHGPAGAWACLGCHEMEARKLRAAGRKMVKYSCDSKMISVLCYKCHDKKETEFSKFKYQHGPVGAGACSACHSPHGSNFRYQLRWEVNTVCVACHENIKKLLEKPNIHGIIPKKGCVACHSPHGTDFLRQLYYPIKELCFTCHPAIKAKINSHGVQGHPVEGRIDPRRREDCEECVDCIDCLKQPGVKGVPRTQEDCRRQCNDCDNRCMFSCASCHNPHASEAKFLLSNENRMQVCTQCHKY